MSALAAGVAEGSATPRGLPSISCCTVVMTSPDAVHGRYDPPGPFSFPCGVCAVPLPGRVAIAAGQCAAS